MHVKYHTIMEGMSVCLFANSFFSSHAIDVKRANPPLRHPCSVLRGGRFGLSLALRIRTEPYYLPYLKSAFLMTRLQAELSVASACISNFFVRTNDIHSVYIPCVINVSFQDSR